MLPNADISYSKDYYSQIFFCVRVIEGYLIDCFQANLGIVNNSFLKTGQIYLRAYKKQFRKMLILISVSLSVLYVDFFFCIYS